MREILFRGKRVDNGEWAYGMPCATEESGIFSIQTLKGGIFDIIPDTVGQYTGLTDKNGKKIFEGDVVRLTEYDNEWKAVVVFGKPYGEYSWGWNFLYIGKHPRCNTDILLWAEVDDVEVYCEIICNIHDNPELLKGE